jgi:hypothetical protein
VQSDERLSDSLRDPSRTDYAVAFAVFSGFSALYWLGRSLTFGPGDSPQHVLSAITWGVSWPPSYPLYVFLGRLAAGFPGSAPGNVNGLTGVLHAAMYALMYATLRKCRLGILPSLLAVVSLGLSPLFWYYSENAEVRALNDLLAIAAAYFAISWTMDRRERDLWGLGVSVGLGIGHHPTYLLIIPALTALLWGRIPSRKLPILFTLAGTALAVPYALLGFRLAYGHPAYNLTGAEHFTDVWNLFLRRDLGSPLRVVAGAGLFGPGGFDAARFIQHTRWFLQALTTHSAWIVFPLALFGLVQCFRSNRRLLLFWLVWFFASAFAFILLGSQQLRLHDRDFAYSVAVRFYLLPMIALYAITAHGAEAIRGRLRAPIHVLLVGLAVVLPVSMGWISLRGKDVVSKYAGEMLAETGPSDMIVLDTDASFFALDYADLVDHDLGDRALLMPSLFSFPPYQAWLAHRYPTLKIPPMGSMMDWARWRMLNPDRALYAEAEWKDAIRAFLPNSAPAGVLIRGCAAGEQCVDPRLAAQRLTEAEVTAFSRRDLYSFSLDIYVLKHEHEMMVWTLELLGTSNISASRPLRNKAADILL